MACLNEWLSSFPFKKNFYRTDEHACAPIFILSLHSFLFILNCNTIKKNFFFLNIYICMYVFFSLFFVGKGGILNSDRLIVVSPAS